MDWKALEGSENCWDYQFNGGSVKEKDAELNRGMERKAMRTPAHKRHVLQKVGQKSHTTALKAEEGREKTPSG